MIVDSDEGWQDNFKRGIVTNYDFLTGLHTIQIESIEELDWYSREIVKAHGPNGVVIDRAPLY